jgi:EmrB/QacA subfamily drug resistance transporter
MIPPRILVPLIVACALFMENLDSTVLATSLPAIARDLGEDPIALKLAVTSYLLSLAVFIPASGWVADRFGARIVFRLAIAVFTLGSITCGLSGSMGGLVLGRIIQGMGGAMMVPVGRLVILRTVPKSELVGSLAWLTIPALMGPILGPLVGGFITTNFSWRWIFWINVPIGVIGIALAARFIPDLRAEEVDRFDTSGFLLSGVGLASLVIGSTSLGLGFWPVYINMALLVVGVAALVFYVRHAGRVTNPILDLALLKIPTFRASIIGGSLFRIGIGATPFLLPLLLQFGFGLTAFQSGALTFAGGIGALAMKIAATPIVRRFGFRRVLLVNAFIAAGFIATPALFTPSTPGGLIVAVMLVGGFFRSLQFTAINAIAYADIDQPMMSRATGFTSVVQQLSLSLGVSVGALTLEATRHLKGDPQLVAADFTPAFLVVGGAALFALAAFVRLPANAGDELSGRGRARPDPVTVARER